MSNTMKIDATDETLSSAGVDQTEAQAAEEALNSQQIQDEIKARSKDGEFTEEEQNEIGEMVADKASEALGGGPGKEGLSEREKMAIAEYCSKCFDTDANWAAEESAKA